VLDLHGEDEFTWAYSDPLCAALQVINHLQDCAKDYCALDRVYLPLDMMKAQGTSVEALASVKASSALQACLRSIASKAAELLPKASMLPLAVQDARLGLETGIIVRLAHKLIALLMIRDPLSERVHLTRLDAMLAAAHGAATTLAARLVQPSASPRPGEKR